MREFRHRLLLYGLLASILLIIGLVYWYACFRARTLENFEQQNSLQLKPDCKVYYTSRVQACDNPGTVTENDVLIDYRYHKSHYEKLKEELDAKKETNSDKYLTILSILQDYSDFPDGQSCKISPPGWQQVSGVQESALLGDKHSVGRGNSAQWAFCANLDKEDPTFYQNTGLQYEASDNKVYTTITYNGQKYVRGAFPDFSLSTMSNLYCTSAPSQDMPQFTGLRIDPYNNEVVFIQNMEEVLITEDIIAQFIRNGLCGEATQKVGNIQELRLVAKTQSLPVVKFDKDICNRISMSQIQESMPLSFVLPIAPVKTIPLDSATQQHLLGTTTDLEATQYSLIEEKNEILKTLLKLNPTDGRTRENIYKIIESEIARNRSEIANLERQIRKLRNRGKTLNTVTKNVAAGGAAAAYATGIVGAGVALGAVLARLIGSAVIKRKVRRLKKRINLRKMSLYTLETDFSRINCEDAARQQAGVFGFGRYYKTKRVLKRGRMRRVSAAKSSDKNNYNSFINVCGALNMQAKTSDLCSQTNSVCPNNKPIMLPLRNEAKPFEDQITAINGKIEAIQKEIERIRASYVDVTQASFNSRSVILENPPFKALSWDNKFYVKLI